MNWDRMITTFIVWKLLSHSFNNVAVFWTCTYMYIVLSGNCTKTIERQTKELSGSLFQVSASYEIFLYGEFFTAVRVVWTPTGLHQECIHHFYWYSKSYYWDTCTLHNMLKYLWLVLSTVHTCTSYLFCYSGIHSGSGRPTYTEHFDWHKHGWTSSYRFGYVRCFYSADA